MRYTIATAFAAMMGMSAIYAAPVGPNNTPGRDDLGMPLVYDDNFNQKRGASPQRTYPSNTYENMPGLTAVEPNVIQQKRENSPNRGNDNTISGHLATDPSYLRMGGVVGTKRETRDASPQGFAETAADQTLRQLGLKKENSKSLHHTRDASPQGFVDKAANKILNQFGWEIVHSRSLQTRDASPQGFVDKAANKILNQFGWEIVHSRSLHQTRDASPQGFAETAADQTLRQLGLKKENSKSLH
ncbi:hypothetical protein PTNB85_10507 [Pyrenophora teres f. teres]|nr:hypothetical protein PTNB85_10507 [Pyrenophora teres f. teres]